MKSKFNKLPTTATEIVECYREKRYRNSVRSCSGHYSYAKIVQKVIDLQYNMALDMAKRGIMPGMYTIETKIENDKITLIPKIK